MSQLKAGQKNFGTPSHVTRVRLVTIFSSLFPVGGTHVFTPIGQPEESRQLPYHGAGHLFYAFHGDIFHLSLSSLKD